MTESTLHIDQTAQLYFVAPFWCSTATVGVPPDQRPDFLQAMKEALDEHNDDAMAWQVEKFHSPRTLRRRKYGQVWRSFEFAEAFCSKVAELLSETFYGGVSARVTYFDYGICSIEVAVQCLNLDPDRLEEFAARAEQVKLLFVDELNKGIPNGSFNMNVFDKTLSAFLTRYEVPSVRNKLRPSYDAEIVPPRAQLMCGPVSRNLLFSDTAALEKQIAVSPAAIQSLAYRFLNEANDNRGQTGSDKIPLSHEGFEGAVVVVRRTEDSRRRVSEELSQGADFDAMCASESGDVYRTKLLWSMVQIYWASLYCASEGYFSIASAYGNAARKSFRQIKEELEEMDEFQKIVSMIKFEAQPEKVIVEGEDRIRYAKVWHAYDSEELLRSLSQIQADAAATIEALRDQVQSRIQRRTNRIIGAFTFLTLISVVVDVIVLYDVNERIAPLERLGLLGTIAGSLMALGVLIWLVTISLNVARRPGT